MQHHSGRGGRFFRPLLGVSLAIHFGVALAFIHFMPRKEGAIEVPTTAISINLEASDVLDAREQREETSGGAVPPGQQTEDDQETPEEPVPEDTERKRLAEEEAKRTRGDRAPGPR